MLKGTTRNIHYLFILMFYGPPMGCALCKVRSEYDYDFLNITTILLQTFSWNVCACVYTAETAACRCTVWSKGGKTHACLQTHKAATYVVYSWMTLEPLWKIALVMFFTLNYTVWVDEYWEQFNIFTDNIKNDVIKNIFYIRCRDSGPIFYLDSMKTGQFSLLSLWF